MAELRIPALDFQSYLEAKAPLDSASLNPALFQRFRESLEADRAPRLLDLGTGTGAALRRVLALPLSADLELTGLDRDARSLAQARRRIAGLLRAQGCRVRVQAEQSGWLLQTIAGPRRVRVRLVRGDLLAPGAAGLLGEGGFEYLTAHALLDLLPLGRALRVARTLLAPEGLLYSTLNYDSGITLLPEDRDPDFERALLAAYDRSMEMRRVEGEPTGGAFCGRRLRAELERGGFRVVAEGRSDWVVRPPAGPATRRQLPQLSAFLRALLGMIVGEGLRAADIEPERLQAWRRRRFADLRAGRLGLAARNLDLLAAKG